MQVLDTSPEPAAPPPGGRNRRPKRVLSVVLMVVGALVLADGAITLLWGEPLTALYSRAQQARLGDELETLERQAPTAAERRTIVGLPESRRLAYAAGLAERRAKDGHAIGRISSEAIDLDRVVVQGKGTAALRKSPGHYPETAFPGQQGTVAIAGHRTTYGAPFRRLDQLASGDSIVVSMPYGRFTYSVERVRIVEPSDTWVTRDVAFDRLVLTACHPIYSAAQRIVVFARLDRALARGVAAA